MLRNRTSSAAVGSRKISFEGGGQPQSCAPSAYLQGGEESRLGSPFLELLCGVLHAYLVNLARTVGKRLHQHLLCRAHPVLLLTVLVWMFFPRFLSTAEDRPFDAKKGFCKSTGCGFNFPYKAAGKAALIFSMKVDSSSTCRIKPRSLPALIGRQWNMG